MRLHLDKWDAVGRKLYFSQFTRVYGAITYTQAGHFKSIHSSKTTRFLNLYNHRVGKVANYIIYINELFFSVIFKILVVMYVLHLHFCSTASITSIQVYHVSVINCWVGGKNIEIYDLFLFIDWKIPSWLNRTLLKCQVYFHI